MSQKIERRAMTLKELRIVDDDEKGNTIEGYAAVFDSWSEELGGNMPFREKVVKGAFTESIQKSDIRALVNHDPSLILGRNTAGTLELAEDEKGLFVRIKPPGTQVGKDIVTSLSRGDISQMSIGFTVELDKWSYEDEVDVRELLKVKLFDVSIVTYPAYTQTEVSVRSLESVYQARADEKQIENQKREEKLLQIKAKFNKSEEQNEQT